MAGLSPEDGTFGKKAEVTIRPSPGGDVNPSPLCPRCRSAKVCRDGSRLSTYGDKIQRWLCRDCDLRFSDPNDVMQFWAKREKEARLPPGNEIKASGDYLVNRQICVEETKNLVAEQQTVELPQKSEVDLKGAIVDFIWQLKKENKAEDTIRCYDYALLELARAGINLLDPDNFCEKMPTQAQWTETRKYNLTKAYRCFLNHKGITAKLPKYKPSRPLPYIPPEEYLDQLIAASPNLLAAFLQTLKETGARPIEAWKIQWEELDVAGKKLYISHPAKGGNPRILRISDKLLRMLLSLPRRDKRVFPYKSRASIAKTFRQVRAKAIVKLGNPELRKIDFYTNRYWRATMEYRRLHDFGAVMVLLGHKSLKYVLLYAQLAESYGSNEYTCKEAHTRQEAMQLIETGFEYVLTDREGVSLFRKLK